MSERKKVGSFTWKWRPNVPKRDLVSTTSGNGFGTFVKLDDFLNVFFDFFSKNLPLPLLAWRGIDFIFSNVEIREKREIWEMY